MGIRNLHETAQEIARYINLVSFDPIQTEAIQVKEGPNPTTKILHFPLHEAIQISLHTHIRKNIKKTLWTPSTASGKIVFTPHILSVTVYLKRLREPAWSPPDTDKTEET